MEVIIVDNASSDDTVLKINQFIHQLKTVNCQLITNSSNFGFSRACNLGARIATAEYLLFLNSDMEMIDNHLIDAVEYIQKNSAVGILAPQFLNPDLSIQGSVFPPQTPLNAFKEFWLKQPAYSKYYPQSKSPVSVNSVSGGAILISKKDFRLAGGWNESYFMYYEDLDFCRSLSAINKKIIYFPRWQVVHRHGASGRSLADPANQWRRGIVSAKKYFGVLRYWLITFIIWSGQKFHRLLSLL